MVVFFPPSTHTRGRDSPDFYVRLDAVSSSDDDDNDVSSAARDRRRRRNRRHARLILEVPDDEEEEESDEWDPCLHLGELPLRPMSRFHKALINVLVVVATVAFEGAFVWAALRQLAGGADKKVINWFIAVPVMLPGIIYFLCVAAFAYLSLTRDFSWRPPPAPADENV